MNDLDVCLEVVLRSRQPLRHIRHWISRKPLEIEASFQRTTNEMVYGESNSQSCDHAMTSRDPERSNSWPQYDHSPIYSKTAEYAIQQRSLITRMIVMLWDSRGPTVGYPIASAWLQVLVQWMTSFTRLYLECADTYTLHIISDGRHWISSWWLHDHGSQQLSGLVQQITDVLSISSALNSVSTTSN